MGKYKNRYTCTHKNVVSCNIQNFVKRFLVTILALVYLSTSVGATVHMHYCMDKLVSWSFGHEKSDKNSCPDCGIGKTATDKHCGKECNGCCKDEQKQVKLDNDQKVSEVTVYIAQLPLETITPAFSNYSFEYVFSLTQKFPVINAPPQTGNVSLFVRNCVFRI